MNTLLAVDGSDHSYEAVRALKYLRRADQLTLLHVVDAPRPAYPMMVPEVAQELYAQLERSMKEDGEELLTRIQSLLLFTAGRSPNCCTWGHRRSISWRRLNPAMRI